MKRRFRISSVVPSALERLTAKHPNLRRVRSLELAAHKRSTANQVNTFTVESITQALEKPMRIFETKDTFAQLRTIIKQTS